MYRGSGRFCLDPANPADLAGLYIISSIFFYIQQYIMAGVAQKTVYSLRRSRKQALRLPLKVLRLAHPRRDHEPCGNDMDNIANTCSKA